MNGTVFVSCTAMVKVAASVVKFMAATVNARGGEARGASCTTTRRIDSLRNEPARCIGSLDAVDLIMKKYCKPQP